MDTLLSKSQRRCLEIPLQWSHGLSAMDTGYVIWWCHSTLTFNGAMASQPWMHPGGTIGFRYYNEPSMEPWPLSHGYRSDSALHRCGWHPFNGAMASQPWIRHPRPPCKVRPASLQWSHGLSAMDTMGKEAICHSRQSLQWSHGLSAMDTGCGFRDDWRLRNQPSMEPWPLSHGYIPNETESVTLSWTFNGAMASQPWIQVTPAQNDVMLGIPSMEPWPLSHGYDAALNLSLCAA